MAQPVVCAILLTRGTTPLARRTLACFQSQSYENKRLLVYDTAEKDPSLPFLQWPEGLQKIGGYLYQEPRERSIGELRNEAIKAAIEWHNPDVIVHFDDDDWSSPTRIAEQMEALVCRADIVGYTRCLFWRSAAKQAWLYKAPDPDYVIGASMCYSVETWRARPFADLSHREDGEFQQGRRVLALDAYRAPGIPPPLVCEVHSTNFGWEYYDDFFTGKAQTTSFVRAPEWDKPMKKLLK